MLKLQRFFYPDLTKPTAEKEPEDFADSDADHLLRCLNPEELEVAARTNYAYSQENTPKRCLYYAKAMALRYLESAKNDKVKALERMKQTIDFRREEDIDGLRRTLEDPVGQYRDQLKSELRSGHVYVQGYDRDGRSTYVFVPRRVRSHDPTWTIKGHIWTLERAIACSRARDKTVNAVVDFNGFSPVAHAPPTAIGKDLMTTLRQHYVGHVNQIFLVDAPSAFMFLWAVFKPFAGRTTRDKIHFVSSEKQKQESVGGLYNQEEAAPWMMPGGKKNRDLDIDEYLHRTSFDQAFDEK